MSRLDRTATRVARYRVAGREFLGGVVIAGLFAVPLVNLVAPFMAHLFEGLRRTYPHLVAS